jgi:AraC-like DNA-binding protein
MSDDPASQDPELLRSLADWPVGRLARGSAVSEAHFARSFKPAFGVPPHRYLLMRRIERATALPRDTDLSITEIAFQTGWESLGTFGRTFLTSPAEPRAARSRARAAAHEPAASLPASSAPRTGPTSRPQLRRSVAGRRSVTTNPRRVRCPRPFPLLAGAFRRI